MKKHKRTVVINGESFVIPKYAYFSSTFSKYGNVHKAKLYIEKYSDNNPERRICCYKDVISDTIFCFSTGEDIEHAKREFYLMLKDSGVILDKDNEWNQFFRNRIK